MILAMDSFSRHVGRVLRRTRLDRGLTLHDVTRISRGAFKPTTIAGYERGERMISLERFHALATLYQIPAEQLLDDALRNLRPPVTDRLSIDMDRIGRISDPERTVLAELVHRIRTRRGDFLSHVVTLRARDLEQIALETQLDARSLLRRLRPALLAAGAGAARTPGKFPTSIDSRRTVRSGRP